MPKSKLTKSVIDALEPTSKDKIYWDAALPGFGVKVTPKGRKVFIALYRVRGGKSRLRKYTIGAYGKLTLHHARATASAYSPNALKVAIRRERDSNSVGEK